MRKRLLLSYLTIAVVVLIGLEVPLGIAFARSERRRIEQSVHQDAITLSIRSEEQLEGGPDATSRTELLALLRHLQRTARDRAILVDAHRSIVADTERGSEHDADRGQHAFGSPEIERALAGHETTGTRYSEGAGGDVYFVAVPVKKAGDVIGAVRVTRSLAENSERVRDNWFLLGFIGLGVLGIVLAVSVVIARSVTKPLGELERAASRLGQGALDARAPVPPGPAEIRLLVQEFNTTAAQLEALVGAQRAFVADASHQLRTPLAALRLRLENLASQVEGASSAEVEAARDEAQRLTRLVDGLLTLARAEQTTTSLTDVDIAAVIGGRVDTWSPFAAERDVSIVSEVEPRLFARATRERLEQVLDNLLNNALEIAPAGSRVTLAAARHGDRVVVRVRDEGPGMTAEQRARAFDRFWRAPGAAREHGGFGLGLAIVRQLVVADGGSVELRAPDGGGLEAVIDLAASQAPLRSSLPIL